MRKENVSQTNFTSGEMSPWLIGRTDIERYINGAESLENLVVRNTGAAVRRRGSQYHAHAANQAANAVVRAEPFIFSRTQARVVGISEFKFRFLYASGQPILKDGEPYEVVHPYRDIDIPELQFSQSADILFITHPLYPPATLSRFADIPVPDWRYAAEVIDYGPYMDQQPGDQDISLAARDVQDSATLTSTLPDFDGYAAAGGSAGALVEYAASGQKMLGRLFHKEDNFNILINPLEDFCLVLSPEVYSPGMYVSWDATNSVPVYANPIVAGPGKTIAFSATAVITQEHIGNYLRFCDQGGTYRWMKITAVKDIVQQGAYGILAVGDVLDVFVPNGIVTRHGRNIYANLYSSVPGFFDPIRDINPYQGYNTAGPRIDVGRNYRLILGDDVVHCKAIVPHDQFGKTVVLKAGFRDVTYSLGGTNASNGITATMVAAGVYVFGEGVPLGTKVDPTTFVETATTFDLTAAATVDNGSATVFMGPWQFTTQRIPVRLYRSMPLSPEGNRVVQDSVSNDWNRGSFFKGNYPAAVAFHEQRLGYAGTFAEPQTGWLSRTADYYNYATTDDKLKVFDTSAITFSFASNTVNQILWMASRSMLVIGTVGGEWKANSGNTGSALTPTNICVQNQSSYGSEFTQPLIIGKSLFYIQRGRRRMWEMSYDYQSDDLVSVDVSIFSSHILKDHLGALQLVYQLLPESTVYVRLGDGQIGVLTYEPVQKVYAWSRFRLGGNGAFVESMCCVPDGNTFRLFLVVRRLINNVVVRTIESILPEFQPTSPTDKVDMIFMDSYTEFLGAFSDEALFDSRFWNQTVDAIIDNTVYTGIVVGPTGNVTLPAAPAFRLAYGFNYWSILRTYPLNLQGLYGTADAKKKRISKLTVRLQDTIGFSYGERLDRMYLENFRVPSPITTPPTPPPIDHLPMFTGDRQVPLTTGFDGRCQYYIAQTKPYPMSILALVVESAQYE